MPPNGICSAPSRGRNTGPCNGGAQHHRRLWPAATAQRIQNERTLGHFRRHFCRQGEPSIHRAYWTSNGTLSLEIHHQRHCKILRTLEENCPTAAPPSVKTGDGQIAGLQPTTSAITSSKGRRLIGWDEILRRTAPDAVVMSWRGTGRSRRRTPAARGDHDPAPTSASTRRRPTRTTGH